MALFSGEHSKPEKQDLNDLHEAQENLSSRLEARKQLRPICPDGSGEIGYFDSEMSEWFGGTMIYATKGESKKYFVWDEKLQKGQLVDPKLLPSKKD